MGWYATLPLVFKIILWTIAAIAGCYALYFVFMLVLALVVGIIGVASVWKD